MVDINLSKSVRSNLSSLQSTASLMNKTSDRLSTGNKVNSALDNPTNFFTAASLNSRAGDLNQLMDSMANGIKTIEAADNGLSSITKTLESMQSTLRQARQDKTFQTKSFELSDGATGNISFSGGALGGTTNIALNNTTLTPTALGLNTNPAAGTAGVGGPASAGTASFSVTGALGLSDDTVSFGITVDGGTAQTINLNTASLTAAGVTGGDITNNDQLVAVINNQLTGATAAVVDGAIVIRSATTGDDSTVAVGAATITAQGANTTDNATVANLGIGAATTEDGADAVTATAGNQTFTFGSNPVDLNKNAKIAFNIEIDGVARNIEISRADVMKAGNNDGTIDSAEEFAAILTSKLDGASAAADANGVITVTSATTGTGSSIEITAATVSGSTAYTADELVQKINNDDDLKGKIRASNDDGKLRVENQSTQELNVGGVTSSGIVTGSGTNSIGGNTVRADLAKQFNELRDQLDKLSDDASFNGINLLRGDKLTITFNETGTSSIDIQAKDEDQLNAAKLGVFDIEDIDLDSDTNIDGLLTGLKTALNSVRSQASAFGSNLSVVQNRQDFTQKMINTLETGAGNLTLADMNQEAANMMALQTRQSLASSTLSMANQADQNVLQLLR